MKRDQDQTHKNSSGKHEREANQANDASNADSRHVERNRNTKNDEGQKTGNGRHNAKYSRNKQSRPLL